MWRTKAKVSMESTGPNKGGDAIQETNPPGGQEYFTQEEFNAKYLRLKRFVQGSQLLTQDEKWLFMNAEEAFNIN